MSAVPGGPGLPASSLERLTVSRAEEMEALRDLRNALRADLAENTAKAWDALARYKFWMFGYHAAHVVKLRRLLGLRGNPFKALVDLARSEQGTVCRG